MRTTVLLLALFMALGALGCGLAGSAIKVERSHDRFTGEDKVSFYGCLGWTPMCVRGSQSSWEAVLFFETESSDWKYLRCHNMDLLADGIVVPLGPPDHQGDVVRKYMGQVRVLEKVGAAVPVDGLRLIARASRLEGRLCHFDFQIDGKTGAVMRQWAAASLR